MNIFWPEVGIRVARPDFFIPDRDEPDFFQPDISRPLVQARFYFIKANLPSHKDFSITLNYEELF